MILLELAREVGIDPKWKASTNGGEYHSGCPSCGGQDRFFIQPNRSMKKCSGYYCCRQCGKQGDSIQFCIDFLGLSFKAATDRIGTGFLGSWEHRFIGFASQKTNGFRPVEIRSPSEAWIQTAHIFVEWACQNILQKPDILKSLEARGLPVEAVKKYKIGWCPQNYSRDGDPWGLNLDNDKLIWLPKGIVIPIAESNGDVIRLKVRRHDYKDGDKLPKYMAISGSMNGLSMIGDKSHDVMVVVESELDAYAVNHAAGDFAFVIAIGSNIKNPDNVTDHYAKKVSKLLICHDNDDGGKAMLAKWERLYPHAKGYPTPMGKDIGDAIKLGLNVREWIKASGL